MTAYTNQYTNHYNPNFVGIQWAAKIFNSLSEQKVVTYSFSDLITRVFAKQYTTKGDFGFFFVSLKQGHSYCTNEWDHTNVMLVLATCGGLLASSYII